MATTLYRGRLSGASCDHGKVHPLTRAFVDAYPQYVESAVERRGWSDTGDLAAAVTEGAAWLESELESLLARPFDRQTRSPLEIFQEAMRFPTRALSEAGAPAVARDEVEAVALPGDLYGLAPASSQVLGEDAWRAHLTWGAEKAAWVRKPVVVLVSRSLLDGSKIEWAVDSTGCRLQRFARLPDDPGRPLAVLVDLEHPDADDAIRLWAGVSRVVAFGPHVDDVAMVRARSLGADEALARSRFFATLPDLLPRVV